MLSWSTGKDAAYCLDVLRRVGTFEVVALLTTVEARTGRVATHGIRRELLQRQVASVGLPLARVTLPRAPSNVVYERAMGSVLRRFRAQGVRHVVFGDLFLEDIRQYREHLLAKIGMECVFPLWGRDTRQLAQEMIGSGLHARVVSVDSGRLPASLAGRSFDQLFLDELPAHVDPCGENGEFHTFVTAGPMLRREVEVHSGDVRTSGGMGTVDLRLAST